MYVALTTGGTCYGRGETENEARIEALNNLEQYEWRRSVALRVPIPGFTVRYDDGVGYKEKFTLLEMRK